MQVADAAGVGNEVDARAIGRPMRIDVLATAPAAERMHHERREIEDRQLVAAERQARERRRESIRGEYQPLAVG